MNTREQEVMITIPEKINEKQLRDYIAEKQCALQEAKRVLESARREKIKYILNMEVSAINTFTETDEFFRKVLLIMINEL